MAVWCRADTEFVRLGDSAVVTADLEGALPANAVFVWRVQVGDETTDIAGQRERVVWTPKVLGSGVARFRVIAIAGLRRAESTCSVRIGLRLDPGLVGR